MDVIPFSLLSTAPQFVIYIIWSRNVLFDNRSELYFWSDRCKLQRDFHLTLHVKILDGGINT